MTKYFALKRHDGGVEIMNIYPIHMRIGDEVFAVRMKEGRPIGYSKEAGWVDVSHFGGAELIYTTPQENIAKLTKEHQAEIESVEELAAEQIPSAKGGPRAGRWTMKDIKPKARK